MPLSSGGLQGGRGCGRRDRQGHSGCRADPLRGDRADGGRLGGR
ncbi:hypothetical protein A176_005542 [Myxococcus hansupus]|uniref:Uncharacterized protein n=1 Tax=Pseudomyxococcus hansupus TaxID=1297742 RepID=A0A0H4X4W2_9BACT|nr:hypothetical protein A176_005542 [Myxococcus hansupus]